MFREIFGPTVQPTSLETATRTKLYLCFRNAQRSWRGSVTVHTEEKAILYPNWLHPRKQDRRHRHTDMYPMARVNSL